MDLLQMAEELAWLVKDNLSCKHLILSAEETFIEFLNPDKSAEDVLELEPMLSYHRMLLHRLADIFRLLHESIGEGDERRLLVERCEDSSIPPVLVSDVLKEEYGETEISLAPCKILTRKTLPDTSHKQPASQIPSLSFVEREAAYLAARERIFSINPSNEIKEAKSQTNVKPRPVPTAALRMIAHALGKRSIIDSSMQKSQAEKDRGVQHADNILSNESSSLSPTNIDKNSVLHDHEKASGNRRDSLDASYVEEQRKVSISKQSLPVVLEGKVTNDTSQNSSNACLHSPKVLPCTQAEAAKRIFAQALGFPFASSSKGHTDVSHRNDGRVSHAICAESSDVEKPLVHNVSCSSHSDEYVSNNDDCVSTRCRNSTDAGPRELQPSSRSPKISSQSLNRRAVDDEIPGRAAGRIFAQALGIQSLSSGTNSSKVNRHKSSSSVPVESNAVESTSSSPLTKDEGATAVPHIRYTRRNGNHDAGYIDRERIALETRKHSEKEKSFVHSERKHKGSSASKMSKKSKSTSKKGSSEGGKHENSNFQYIRASIMQSSPVPS